MLDCLSAGLRKCVLTAALAGPLPAAAATTGGYTLDYTGYSHGLTVLKLTATLILAENRYNARVTFHTAGLAGFVVHADSDSRAAGTFCASQACPSLFESSGHLRGVTRLTRITYIDGNPTILALTPPVEQERAAVSAMNTGHTIDSLSALALLIHLIGQTGHCDGSVTTFDGRRLATQTVHTFGRDSLKQTGRSIYAGPVLRCDFEARQLAGFIRGENEADLRRPRHGTAWLADILPTAPPVPVRVAFENRLLGQVTLYLTALTASKAP